MTERNEIQIDPIDLAAIRVVMSLAPEELTGLERLRARIAAVPVPCEITDNVDALLYCLQVLAAEEVDTDGLVLVQP